MTEAPTAPATERIADGAPEAATVTDLVQRTAALEIKSGQRWWTAAQKAALDAIGLNETPDGDVMAFLHLCQATGLDPFRKEIYLIGRKDSTAPSGKKWTAQTGIDGFRFIAERTGEYLGRTDPEWCGADGVWKDVWLAEEPPAAARVRVKRRVGDEVVVTTGTVMYREFCPMKDEYKNNQRTGNRVPQGQWGTMPAHMLAKCAEAFAIRSAFPRQVAGVYLHEEMQKADEAEKAAQKAEQAEARRKAREEGAARPWASREGVVITPPGAEPQQADSAPQEPAEGVVAPEPTEPHEPGSDGIVDAEIVPDDEEPAQEIVVDRDALMAEIDDQAKALGQTRQAMLRRWVSQHRKNIEDATDEELLALVVERREMVAWKRSQDEEKPTETAVSSPDDPFVVDL